MATPLRAIDGSGQLGMDEKVIEDKDLANLLEKRLRLADDKAEISKSFKAADKDVKAEIDKLDLADGQAIRIGRFRIARQAVPPPLRVVRYRGDVAPHDRALDLAH